MRKYLYIFVVISIVLSIAGVKEASAAIVDINSRTNYRENPVQLFLSAGTYTITSIGTATGGAFNAWNAWSATTCADPNGCALTSPTTVVGWLNVYNVQSTAISNFTVGGTPISFDPFYNGYIVNSWTAYPDPLSALAAAQNATFTLNTTGYVGFAVTDLASVASDNSGGISLDINTASVPEPATMFLLGSGLVGLGFMRRRFKG